MEALRERGIITRHHKNSSNLDAPPFEESQRLLSEWLAIADHKTCPPKIYPVLYSAGAIHN